ncbi:hypothetical protein HY990_02175 [Candidatus Micrarchaeota archaeon]|nr:hypothetical protein [Candidatus Micrarchaeota archaeon]
MGKTKTRPELREITLRVIEGFRTQIPVLDLTVSSKKGTRKIEREEKDKLEKAIETGCQKEFRGITTEISTLIANEYDVGEIIVPLVKRLRTETDQSIRNQILINLIKIERTGHNTGMASGDITELINAYGEDTRYLAVNYFLERVRNGHRINLQIEELCIAAFDLSHQIREIALETLKRYGSRGAFEKQEIEDALEDPRVLTKKDELVKNIRNSMERDPKDIKPAELQRVIKETIKAETVGRIEELLERE